MERNLCRPMCVVKSRVVTSMEVHISIPPCDLWYQLLLNMMKYRYYLVAKFSPVDVVV